MVTVVVESIFYRLSARSLRSEAESLRAETKKLENLINILGRGFESTGLLKFNRDAEGNFIGVVINLRSSADVKTYTSEVNLKVE